jgi:hypothetical protein
MINVAYTATDAHEEWINEGRSINERRHRAQMVAREGRVTVEVPPYAAVSVPEWAPRWGEGGPPPVGTVLSWTPVDQGATFVAICTSDDEWFTTDPGNRGGAITFSGLARMIANSPCEVVVDWREVPTVAARPSGKDAVKDWAAQFLAPQAPAVESVVDEGH